VLAGWIITCLFVRDSEFVLGYACMMAPYIAAMVLGKIPVYIAHEWVWGDEHVK
jgi:hypothetical protein